MAKPDACKPFPSGHLVASVDLNDLTGVNARTPEGGGSN
jgi:hypothetical protein